MTRGVKVLLSERATNVLRKLTFEEQKRLYAVILSLKTVPFPSRAEQIPTSVGSFRITVGTHRILYEIEGTTIRVEVIRSILSDLF